ncbi:DUF3304 domain-containing protein [Xanthomonas sacchari]
MQNRKTKKRIQYWNSLSMLVACISLSGCGNDRLPASVTGYNHMSDWSIERFTVDGASGPNLSPEEGGGGGSCCASIPRRWHPGMKVKIQWTYDTTQNGPQPPSPQEAIVDLPQYPSQGGDIQVHFYPDHKVKVVISEYGIGHPLYPMSEEDKRPWETRKDLLLPQLRAAPLP